MFLTSQSSWSAICRKVMRSWVRRRTTSCCRTRPRSWFGVRQAMSPPWWEGTDFRRGGILGAAIRGYDDAPSTQVDGAFGVLQSGGLQVGPGSLTGPGRAGGLHLVRVVQGVHPAVVIDAPLYRLYAPAGEGAACAAGLDAEVSSHLGNRPKGHHAWASTWPVPPGTRCCRSGSRTRSRSC